MKRLLFSICFLFAVVIASAQAGGYNPIKNIRMDVSWNEHIGHGGFGWGPYTVDGKLTNWTGFLNKTGETLDIRLRIPAIGYDKVFTVPPAMHESDAHWFVLGYDLIPFESWLTNPLMIECDILQPEYSDLRYVWYRGAKRYNK